jgi:hypothetical protein
MTPEAAAEGRRILAVNDPMVGQLEDGLAALLARVFHDEAWWESVVFCPNDAAWRDGNAARAIELYRRTEPVIESSVDADGPRSVDRAAGILREIADLAAMLSNPWTANTLSELRIPTRAVIELGARADDLDRWASSLGHPLNLVELPIPDEAWPEEPPDRDYEPELAAHIATVIRAYDVAVDLRVASGGDRLILSGDDFREGACAQLSLSRGWLIWTRGNLPEAELAAVVTVFASQALFIASREETTEAELFPSKEFVRTLIESSEAKAWLLSQDVDLPSWLT